jgi:hypothetical protein
MSSPTTTTTTTQQPDIPLPSSTGEVLQLVSKKDFDEHKKDFNFQKNILNWTFGFIVAILIVCFGSFLTFIVDAWKFHGETTKEYNKTIEELKSNNSDLKIEMLKNKIDILEKRANMLESATQNLEKKSKK